MSVGQERYGIVGRPLVFQKLGPCEPVPCCRLRGMQIEIRSPAKIVQRGSNIFLPHTLQAEVVLLRSKIERPGNLRTPFIHDALSMDVIHSRKSAGSKWYQRQIKYFNIMKGRGVIVRYSCRARLRIQSVIERFPQCVHPAARAGPCFKKRDGMPLLPQFIRGGQASQTGADNKDVFGCPFLCDRQERDCGADIRSSEGK